MGRNRVVNIVNFIRGVEPRRELDLVEPVRRLRTIGVVKG